MTIHLRVPVVILKVPSPTITKNKYFLLKYIWMHFKQMIQVYIIPPPFLKKEFTILYGQARNLN